MDSRIKGQFSCFLEESELGITSKQGEEACCYDVSLPFPFLFCSVLFVGVGLGRGWDWDMNEADE